MVLLTLGSARINVDLTQSAVVDILKKDYGLAITRQKLADYEKDSTNIPINIADALSEVYFVSRDDIFFGCKSTLSYSYRKEKIA